MPSTSKFSCDSCNKTYTWKPELAGKRAKCKCGQPLRIPETDPAGGVSDNFDDLAALAERAPAGEQTYAAAPASGGACPSCGSGVDPSAVLCVNCGHNLKTGKKLKTSKPSASSAAAVMPGYRSFDANAVGEPPMSAKKRKIIAASLVGGLAAIVGIVLAITIPASIKEKERMAKLNAQHPRLEKFMENSEKAGGMVEAMKNGTLYDGVADPARQKALATAEMRREIYRLDVRGETLLGQKGPLANPWLASAANTHLLSHDHAQSVKIIDDLEAMGATDIHTTDQAYDDHNGGMFCMGLVGTLSTDPAKRGKFFAWYDSLPKTIEDGRYVHQSELGQKYFTVEFKE